MILYLHIHKGGMVMNSELLTNMLEKIESLGKRKRQINCQIKKLGNEEYLNEKGLEALHNLQNELNDVKSLIETIKSFYSKLKSKSEEYEALQVLFNTADDKSKNVVRKVLENYEIEIEELKEKIKLIITDEEQLEDENKENNSTVADDKPIEEENQKNKNTKNKKLLKKIGIAAGICGAASLALLAGRGCSKKSFSSQEPTVIESYEPSLDNGNTNEFEITPTPVQTETISATPTPVQTETISATPTPTVVPTETQNNDMLDATDIDAVYTRAEEMYSKMPYLDEIDHNYKGEEVQTLANLIRVLNGELPLDENRNTVYSPTLLDDNLSAMVDIMDNYPSSPQLDENSKSYYSDLVAWDEEVYNFAKKYDEVYANISDARNNDDFEAFENNVQTLGKLLYEDWVMNGANTGVNPYGFAATQRYLALSSSIGRYSSSVIEYASERGAVICVDVCYDYETGELKEVKVSDIYEAIRDGVRNDATLDIFLPDGEYLIELGFYNDLAKELEFKYENTLSYTLK